MAARNTGAARNPIMGSRPVGTGPRFIGLALVDVRRLFVKAESSDRNGRQTRNRPRQSRTRRYRSADNANAPSSYSKRDQIRESGFGFPTD